MLFLTINLVANFLKYTEEVKLTKSKHKRKIFVTWSSFLKNRWNICIYYILLYYMCTILHIIHTSQYKQLQTQTYYLTLGIIFYA